MTTTLPWSWYDDPQVHARELATIFAGAWAYAGPLARCVPSPGSIAPVLLADGSGALITCDGDGTLHAVRNVCRHRGARLVDEPCVRSTIQCPYHAWTYGLDGQLVAAPRAAQEGLDIASGQLDLVRLEVDTWAGLAFVRAGSDGPSLAEWLGPVPAALAAAGVDVATLKPVHHAPLTEVGCNWKVACENYLECYHCQVAHPGFSAAIDVHASRYELDQLAPHVLSQRGARRDPDDPLVAGPVEAASFHLVWPNLVINVNPGHPNLSIGPVLPRGPLRTARFLDYLAAPDAPAGWLERLLAWDAQVGDEDVALVETVQAGMESRGPLEAGVLLPGSEQLVARFGALVRARVDDA